MRRNHSGAAINAQLSPSIAHQCLRRPVSGVAVPRHRRDLGQGLARPLASFRQACVKSIGVLANFNGAFNPIGSHRAGQAAGCKLFSPIRNISALHEAVNASTPSRCSRAASASSSTPSRLNSSSTASA